VARQERLLLCLQKTVEDLVRRIDRTQAGDQGAPTVPLDDAAADIQQADAASETFSDGGSEAVSENTAAYDIEAGDLISSEGLNHLRAQRLTGLGVLESGHTEESPVPGHRVAFDM
jgi:ABC-type microcin C transport system permease subunit YejB